MPRLTTSRALQRILRDEDYLPQFLGAGYSKADLHTFRHRLARGKLSTSLIEQILTRCGAQVIQEKVWQLPRS
jgi:hypothetical protein